jgi:hypothetical protein
VGLLIDSEDTVDMSNNPLQQSTWEHLRRRDEWERPLGAEDEQVLLMTNCHPQPT